MLPDNIAELSIIEAEATVKEEKGEVKGGVSGEARGGVLGEGILEFPPADSPMGSGANHANLFLSKNKEIKRSRGKSREDTDYHG